MKKTWLVILWSKSVLHIILELPCGTMRSYHVVRPCVATQWCNATMCCFHVMHPCDTTMRAFIWCNHVTQQCVATMGCNHVFFTCKLRPSWCNHVLFPWCIHVTQPCVLSCDATMCHNNVLPPWNATMYYLHVNCVPQPYYFSTELTLNLIIQFQLVLNVITVQFFSVF